MYKRQLGRRNLTDEQRTVLIGKMYESRKKSRGGNYGNQYTILAKGHNDPKPKPRTTAEAVAREVGVAEPTVKRAERVFSIGGPFWPTCKVVLNCTQKDASIYSNKTPEYGQGQGGIKVNDAMKKKEQEFEQMFAEWMEDDELARKSFEEHPERKELYKKKWFDSLRDRN